MRGKKQTKEKQTAVTQKQKRGITRKLVGAIMGTIVIMVAALLLIVYNRVSDALLEKSENLLTETTGKEIGRASCRERV